MDLIDRQDALEAICTWDKFGVDALGRVVRWYEGLEPYVHLRDVVWAIEKMPSAQPERESGEWIIADTQNKEDEQNGNYRYICSCCRYSDIHSKEVRVPYCWHCGAKMKEASE